MLITIPYSGFVKYGGVGHHIDALEQTNPAQVTIYYKWLLCTSFYYFAVVGIPKLAILVLYIRLFTTNFYRYTVYIVAFTIIATGIVCSVICLNLCHPFALNWNRNLPGHCVNETLFYRWGSLPNIITDVVMLILPMSVV